MPDSSKRSSPGTGPTRTRRTFLKGVGAAGVAGLAGCTQGGNGGGGTGSGGGGIQQVHLTLDWLPKGQLGGFFLAKTKGYWNEEGLTVQMNRGFGSGETARTVGGKQTDFGFAGLGAVTSAIEQGLELREVAMVYDKNATGWLWLDDSIGGVQDFAGMTGAHAPGDEPWAMARAHLTSQGVNWENDIEWLVIDGAGPEQVISGQADFVPDWAMNVPVLWNEDSVQQEPKLELIANSVPVFGNGLIAHADTIEEDRELVESFARGLMRGWKYLIDNATEGALDEAVDAQLQLFPNMALGAGSREFHRANAELALTLLLTEGTREHGIGFMSQERAQSTLDVLNSNLLEGELAIDDVFVRDIISSGDYPIENFDAAVEQIQTIEPNNVANPMLPQNLQM